MSNTQTTPMTLAQANAIHDEHFNAGIDEHSPGFNRLLDAATNPPLAFEADEQRCVMSRPDLFDQA